MNLNEVKQLQEESKAKYKKIYDQFEIGGRVELVSSSHEDVLPSGAEGVVLDKSYGMFGCDLRIDFEGYETWIDAEDLV